MIKRVLAGLVLVGGGLAIVILVMGRFTGRGGGPPAPAADTLRIGHDTSMTIPPAGYQQFVLRLPARICTLSGRFESLDGPARQFEAQVLNDDEFKAWTDSRRDGAIRSGPVAVWSPRVTVVGPGRFHLIIISRYLPGSLRVAMNRGRVVCP